MLALAFLNLTVIVLGGVLTWWILTHQQLNVPMIGLTVEDIQVVKALGGFGPQIQENGRKLQQILVAESLQTSNIEQVVGLLRSTADAMNALSAQLVAVNRRADSGERSAAAAPAPRHKNK